MTTRQFLDYQRELELPGTEQRRKLIRTMLKHSVVTDAMVVAIKK